MIIQLSYSPSPAIWGENALLSFNDQGAIIHLKENEESLVQIQKAARQLRSHNINDVELDGDNWGLESCWAFYQGFYTAKQNYNLSLPVMDNDTQETLLARIICSDFVREIINAPAEEITPVALCERATDFLQEMTNDYAPEAKLHCQVIEGETLLDMGFNGIWTVGKGSQNPPAMLQVDFNPTGNPDAPVLACFVGKGITFDSGGYSLKPADSMASMRTDMGGAALLTGALGMAIAGGLNQRVKLTLCCAENLVNGLAMKVGDIIEYKNGVTAEILNTDAEGRLVLADGLIWASEQNPRFIVDMATLTGAAKFAVGTDYHSVLSLDENLVESLMTAAEDCQELFWRLPFAAFHRQYINSQFADIANIATTTPSPGASTATAFLSHFVKDYQQNWLHIDASATYRPSATSLWAAGATGIGIQTLATFLLNESEK